MYSKRSDSDLVVGLTLGEADIIGLTKCMCGHAMRDHCRPVNCWYCCHCTCGEPAFSGKFKMGTEIEEVKDGQ